MGVRGRAKIAIDLERVTQLAAAGTQLLPAAQALGIGLSTLSRQLKQDPNVRAAWDRGRALLNGDGPSQANAVSSPADDVESPEQVQPEALDPRVLGLKENEELVLGAIKAGHQSRIHMRHATGLSYDSIDLAIFKLRSLGLVSMTKEKMIE